MVPRTVGGGFFRRRIYAREEEGRGSLSPRIKLEDERAQGQGGREGGGGSQAEVEENL